MVEIHKRLLEARGLDIFLESEDIDSKVLELDESLNCLNTDASFSEVYENLRILNDALMIKEVKTRRRTLEGIDKKLLTKLEHAYSKIYDAVNLDINELNKKDLEGRKVEVKKSEPSNRMNGKYRKERDSNFPVGRIGEVIYYRNEDALLLFPKGNYYWSKDWGHPEDYSDFPNLSSAMKERIGIFDYNEFKLVTEKSLIDERNLSREINRLRQIVKINIRSKKDE